MDIKKRLIISNTITAIVPFIIACLTAFIFMLVSSKIFNMDVNYNNFKKLTATKSELLNIVNEVSKSTPENFEDTGFQKYLYGKLSTINGEIVIIKNNNIIFASKDLNKIDIEKCLEEVKTETFKKALRN